MAKNVHNSHETVKRRCANLDLVPEAWRENHAHMAGFGRKNRQLRRHYFKEWREYRGMTQDQAAALIGMDRGNLSKIEARKTQYSQTTLEAAAEAYGCEPWDILNVNPLEDATVANVLDLMREADPEDRAAIEGFARGRIKR